MENSARTVGRRRFLARATAATGLIVWHEALPQPNGAASYSDDSRGASGPIILSLTLRTAAPLKKMRQFYVDTLGLRLLEARRDRMAICAGETRLTFELAAADEGQPFYHFAFNIPENKIRAARDWQRERTPLLPIPRHLGDPVCPNDVVHYRHWDAHSVFFFDPAENVAEYIARHTLKNPAHGAFSSADILYASEIGLIVDDVTKAASSLAQVVGLKQYRGGSDQFTAMGDEQGLLLVMKRGRVVSFDSPRKKAVNVFHTGVAVRGDRTTRWGIPKFPYEVTVEA
jgi:catechol-2,3-dioxygenase